MRLAVDGGSPVRSGPLAPWPAFAEDEIAAAVAALRSGKPNYWGGSEGRQFEEEYASSVGVRHGIALANGTLALELALRTFGIGPGDDVVVTSRTFIASASCAVMVGARPVFADVDATSQDVTVQTVQAALTPRTRAIIAVHLAGWPCDMPRLRELAARESLVLIEDCAQSHGARLDGQPVGSFGDAAAFSFCQDKILTTGGEGGLLLLNDDEHYEWAWGFKDHGKSYDAVHRRQHPPGFRWLHEGFGTNWRMTEMQAAIGRVVLRKLPEWVERRRANAAILSEGLRGVGGLRLTEPPPDVYHSYYKYYAFVKPAELKDGWNRDRIMAAVNAEGVPCLSGSCSEVYLERAFSEDLRPPQRLPVARELGETSLMFLVHPTLEPRDLQETVTAVSKVMETAAR